MAPCFCLVTDGRRLVRAVGARPDERRGLIAAQIEAAVAAGIDIVQVRERDLEAAALLAVVRTAVTLTRGSATRVVVNDRLDVALAAGAAGVHLRGASLAPEVVTAAFGRAGHLLVTRSVHDVGDVDRAEGVSMFLAGTVFETASKSPGHRTIGIGGLRAVVLASRVPVLAIGGVTPANVAAVAATGAAGVAAIGAFQPADPATSVATAVAAGVENLRRQWVTGSGRAFPVA